MNVEDLEKALATMTPDQVEVANTVKSTIIDALHEVTQYNEDADKAAGLIGLTLAVEKIRETLS